MNDEIILSNQICRLILSGRISVFDLDKSIQVYDIRFCLSELTKIKAAGMDVWDTLNRIIVQLTAIDDILEREIKLTQLFQYCEEQDMLFQKFNPFYCHQREIKYYEEMIVKYQENVIKQKAEMTALSIDKAVVAFMVKHLSQCTHVIELQKHEKYADIFLIKYKDKPIMKYTESEIFLYRLYGDETVELCIQIRIHEEELSIKLCDILSTNKSCGYGSIMISFLKRYAGARGKVKICGSMSPFDLRTHGDLLIHFYQKHGFKISESVNGWKPIEFYLEGKRD